MLTTRSLEGHTVRRLKKTHSCCHYRLYRARTQSGKIIFQLSPRIPRLVPSLSAEIQTGPDWTRGLRTEDSSPSQLLHSNYNIDLDRPQRSRGETWHLGVENILCLDLWDEEYYSSDSHILPINVYMNQMNCKKKSSKILIETEIHLVLVDVKIYI